MFAPSVEEGGLRSFSVELLCYKWCACGECNLSRPLSVSVTLHGSSRPVGAVALWSLSASKSLGNRCTASPHGVTMCTRRQLLQAPRWSTGAVSRWGGAAILPGPPRNIAFGLVPAVWFYGVLLKGGSWVTAVRRSCVRGPPQSPDVLRGATRGRRGGDADGR